MKKLLLSLLLLTTFAAQAQRPVTPRNPVTDDYFGLKVTDNYRWLENLQDSSVKRWLEDQDRYTEDIFNRITGRDQLLAEYKALDSLSSDSYYNVRKHGDTYLFLKYQPATSHSVLCLRKGETGKDEVLLDFKKMHPGKKMNMGFFEYSPVSQYLTMYVLEHDFEAATLYFYDVKNRRLFPEAVRYATGGFPEKTKFTDDGTGYFYGKIAVDNNKASFRNMKSMYHKIGTPAEQDKVIMSLDKYPAQGIDSSYWYDLTVDPEYKYAILLTGKESFQYNFIAPYADLAKDTINWTLLRKPADKLGTPFIVNGVAYMVSRDVPKRKLVRSILGNLKNISFNTIVPEMKDRLESVFATPDYLLLKYNNGINDYFKQYNLKTGKLENAPMKVQGIMSTSRISETGNEVRINLTSWTEASTAYHYDPRKKTFIRSTLNSSTKYAGAEELVVKQVEVAGHDGVMIPLTIIYNKNTALDGTAICSLYGYGAYGLSVTPSFQRERLMYGKRGVIFAIAHVRGGSEKGDAWRIAGFKATKPNTWKDFISCAEFLIRNKYTTANRLIGEGISAGGIMIGRAITERPELFAVAISRVGISNALRAEKGVGGPANSAEFGSVKDSSESRYLYEMDAMYHVKEGTKYPAVLCVAGLNDGRVEAWHSAKFAAALQYATASNKPVLLQIYFKGGHFGEQEKRNINAANEWAFILWQAGHPDFKLREPINN